MAKLYISEYQFMGANGYDASQIPREPSLADQVVDFTAGATQSAAFSAATTYISIWSDVDCCVMFGSNPTATTSKRPVAAKTREACGVRPGDKVSVITLA